MQLLESAGMHSLKPQFLREINHSRQLFQALLNLPNRQQNEELQLTTYSVKQVKEV